MPSPENIMKLRPLKQPNPASQYKLSLRGVLLLLLPLLSVAASYVLFFLGDKNGTFGIIENYTKATAPIYPESDEPLVTRYTGIQGVDAQLVVLVTFFSPVVKGNNVPLTLHTHFGFGQFGAGWTLLIMESLRRGNKGRLVSFITTYGVLVQNLTFAVTTPLFLFIHLLTSPISKPFSTRNSGNDLLVSPYDLAILPFSVILGYIIPSLLMAFPGSAYTSSPTHQRYIAFWQAFPVWTMLVQWTGKWLCTRLVDKSASAGAPKSSTSSNYLRAANRVYVFVMILTVTTTVPAIILSILPSEVFPASLPALSYLAHSTFVSVFIPMNPLVNNQVNNLTEGVHNFLLWDVYIAAAASLLWGVFLYRNASIEQNTLGGHPNGTKTTNSISWLKLIVKVSLWTIVAGPFGALSILLWERDAIVRQKVKEGV